MLVLVQEVELVKTLLRVLVVDELLKDPVDLAILVELFVLRELFVLVVLYLV